MPIKKSALLLIFLSVSSLSLLVFSAAIVPTGPVAPDDTPVKYMPVKCCSQLNDPKIFSTWDMISQIMWRSGA